MYREDVHASAEAAADVAERLSEMVHEALSDHDGKLDAAIEQFIDRCELEPTLMLGVLGKLWRVEATAYFRRVWLSAQGRKLREGVNLVRNDREQKRERAARVELGLLGEIMIEGKPLAICTRAEVAFDQQRSGHRARFLGSLVDLLPTDDAIVKDHITPTQAAKLMQAAAA